MEYRLWIVDAGLKVKMRGREVWWPAVGYPGSALLCYAQQWVIRDSPGSDPAASSPQYCGLWIPAKSQNEWVIQASWLRCILLLLLDYI